MISLKKLLTEGWFPNKPAYQPNDESEIGFGYIVKYVQGLSNVYKNSIKIEKLLNKQGNYIKFIWFDSTTKERTTVGVVISGQFYVFFGKNLVFKNPYAFSVIDFLSKNL